ncbi:FAD-dependent oxidoreductase [Actinoplanes sp. CA-252034]|uniref:FAD-dependent oxidoreductase n=1 Tax=Actinoplanes sp. CA-252034 TaxID=3239906 RepID=UPI003D95972D
MRVVVCGAGIGGLSLAHALSRHVEVVVVERDVTAADTGGYRISIDDEACRALGRLLPGALLDEVRSLSDTGSAFEQFTIADSRLRPIVVAPEPAGQDRILAQRQLLRVLLARDITATIRFGSTVRAVSQDQYGAAVTLTDGSVIEGDLVVAADGADSAVVASILGRSPTRDLGLTGIAGWTPLSDASPPGYLRRGPALAFGPDGTGVFLSLHHPPATPTADPLIAGLLGEPALIWGTITRSSRLTPTRDAAAEALVHQATTLLDRWSPWLRERVSHSDASRTAAFRFRAVDPAGPIAGWTPGVVTALGDAIHAMPPTGGRGASTAICDAADLARAVDDHLQGAPLDQVLARYQRRIVPRARSAVRDSLGPVRVINALRHRPARLLARPVLNAAGALGAWRYRDAR